MIPTLADEEAQVQRNEIISPSHTALPGPGRMGIYSGSWLSHPPCGPYLALQETGWDDLGQSRENDSPTLGQLAHLPGPGRE